MKHYFILAFILFFLSAKSQEPVTGMQYRNATENSLDVMGSHLVLYQAQSKYNKMLNYISYTTHVGKGLKLMLNDGSVINGDITRVTIPFGVGLGSVEKIGAFIGVNNELQLVRGVENKNVTADIYQGMFFFGISCLGFQADYGIFGGSSFSLDGNSEFPAYKNQIAKDNSKLNGGRIFFSVYHKTGFYFSAIYRGSGKDDGNSDANFKLDEFRFSVQPLKKYLPDIYGLPFVELAGYTPLSSYATKYKDYYDAAFQIDSATANKKTYDLTPGSNNINKKGVRAAITVQAYPKVAFKKVELAYNFFLRDKSQVYGAKSQLFIRDHKPKFSFDIFATITFVKRITLSCSYSYNSPDNIVFLPLPDLHVIGLQIIFGRRETARAIIPYAASVLTEIEIDEEKEKKKEKEKVKEKEKEKNGPPPK